ncbi:hypothetical protein [Litoreibacter roseus]|uniref:Uncharacterized protein n=1 Tax=Litoreibacter roseus TaxID=2601869 RepID=A0A6N6JAI3_9RHOB|nr:hypothetical protein [Litoreibacter roseus]GFE63253.1 hypothetical protein KIN_03270 [Litoreibacter roseus]
MIRLTAITGFALGTVLAASAGLAQSIDATIAACHTKAAAVEDAVAALSGEGWAVVDERPLPEIVAEQLVWPQLVFYFTGDTGGETLQAILDLQRKTVAGFARKVDIDQSKTRILTRTTEDQPETLLLAWQAPTPNMRLITCRASLSEATTLSALAAITLPAGPQPDFLPLPAGNPLTAAPGADATLTLLNTETLSEKLDTPVTANSVLVTSNSFDAEAQ